MALTAGQIPKVANVLNSGVGVVAASSNIVTLGSNTNSATVYTAGTSGSRIISLVASTDDTVASNIFIFILRGATVQPLGLVPVAASAGNVTGTRNNDMLNGTNIPGLPVDNTGRQYISLMPNDVLKAGSLVGLSAAKTVFITAQGLDYQT
jgi:hypothetical protein